MFSVKKYTNIEVLVVLFFAVEYFREALLYFSPMVINLISLFISLLLIYSLQIKISKRVRVLLFLMFFFVFFALFKGLTIGFFDPKVLIYSFFKAIEYLSIVVTLSKIGKKTFYNILTLLIKVFIFINLLLLLYYFCALVGVLPSINRVVIFDYRFAGLSGEPAQFAQHCVLIIFSILLVNKYRLLKHPSISISIVLFMTALSFSNSIVLLSAFLFVYYLFFIGAISYAKKILYFFILIPLGYFSIEEIFTRLTIDYDTIFMLFNNIGTLSDKPIYTYSELTSSNSVTVRFFEFIYSLSLINQLIGNGFGSTLSYARYAGYIPNDSFINMYGITQIGFELGLIPMFVFIIFLLYFIFIISVKFSTVSRLLIASLFFMILVMNGIGFKFVWFFIFALLIHKEWFLKKGYHNI
ncbi:hypothetical protein [Photobacterium damselae]|uniref:hypothetical protein n=1 Tax=Photobacterium damselae TaxID=38293 RepID=UPI0010FE36BE|nr:hypothetical protein [Photobacterium damselae]TLS69324.1 hypothetical protein FD718_12895 [Photobacterium damselae subsp. damselae]